jgi:hypothetical protein
MAPFSARTVETAGQARPPTRVRPARSRSPRRPSAPFMSACASSEPRSPGRCPRAGHPLTRPRLPPPRSSRRRSCPWAPPTRTPSCRPRLRPLWRALVREHVRARERGERCACRASSTLADELERRNLRAEHARRSERALVQRGHAGALSCGPCAAVRSGLGSFTRTLDQTMLVLGRVFPPQVRPRR